MQDHATYPSFFLTYLYFALCNFKTDKGLSGGESGDLDRRKKAIWVCVIELLMGGGGVSSGTANLFTVTIRCGRNDDDDGDADGCEMEMFFSSPRRETERRIGRSRLSSSSFNARSILYKVALWNIPRVY